MEFAVITQKEIVELKSAKQFPVHGKK